MRAVQCRVSLLPTGSNSPVSMTRRRPACCSRPRVSISSSRMVPLPAALNLPSLARSAPVKAPLTWPKKALSIKLAGWAPHGTDRNGFSLRGEQSCMSRARNVFPVPVSPVGSGRRDAVEVADGAGGLGLEQDDDGGEFLEVDLLRQPEDLVGVLRGGG